MFEIAMMVIIVLLALLFVNLSRRNQTLLQKVQESERNLAFYSDFINTIPIPLYIKTEAGFSSNKAFAKAFGTFSKEAYDALSLLPRNCEQTISLTYDNRISKNAHSFNATLLDSEKNIRGFAGALFDVTPLMKSKELVLSQKERLDLALEGSGDGVWDWDVKKETFFFSKQWKSIMGYDEDDRPCTLEAWLNLVHPKDMATVNSKIASLLQGQNELLFVEHRLRNSEPLRWIAVRGKVIYDRREQPKRIVGTIRDITARKLSEEKEHTQLSLFLSYFEHLPAIAFIKDEKGKYLYMNNAYQRFIGFKTWQGKNALELFDATTAQAIEESDRMALYEGKTEHQLCLPTLEGLSENLTLYKFPIDNESNQKFLCGFGVVINNPFN